MTIVAESLRFASLFEAELLLQLMLQRWGHPFADSMDFRADLLEAAVAALEACVAGAEILRGVPPEETNFVAAVWYAEWAGLQDPNEDHPAKARAA